MREITLQPWDSEYDDDNDRYLARFRNSEESVELIVPESDIDSHNPVSITITQES